jgi:hypothetical protein
MKTLATLLFAVMGPLVLAAGLAPHAYADTNGYLTCLASHGISGDTNTELVLGDEAYNTLRGRPRGQTDIEARALSRKYNLSEPMASAIVACATTFPPV